MLIFRQKSFQFFNPPWKLDNPYCHRLSLIKVTFMISGSKKKVKRRKKALQTRANYSAKQLSLSTEKTWEHYGAKKNWCRCNFKDIFKIVSKACLHSETLNKNKSYIFVSTGAEGAQTCSSLGTFLQPLILILIATRWFWGPELSQIQISNACLIVYSNFGLKNLVKPQSGQTIKLFANQCVIIFLENLVNLQSAHYLEWLE